MVVVGSFISNDCIRNKNKMTYLNFFHELPIWATEIILKSYHQNTNFFFKAEICLHFSVNVRYFASLNSILKVVKWTCAHAVDIVTYT